MNFILLLAGIFILVVGCLQILAKDIFPQNRDRKNWLQGKPSSWNESRENAQNILGILSIIAAVIMLLNLWRSYLR